MSYRPLIIAYVKAWVCTLLVFAFLISSNALYAQVTMVQPFVPSYNYAIAYTTGCAADLCIPTVYAGLDENADPIYVHHDVQIDLSVVGSGSLVIGMAGGIASVSGPIQDRINNLLRGYAVDLTTLYAWENGANSSGAADVALEGGDCLIKPELVLPEVLFSDCIEAGAALHGNFIGYQNSSPNCVAPSGFLEFFYDNSLYAGPQVEFQWVNASSPLEACDESELDAAIESVGPIAEMDAEDIAPELIAAMQGSLPPFEAEETEEEELRRRLAELYGTTYTLPPYSQIGGDFTADYEEDGAIDGGTVDPDPPLGGYTPEEGGGEGDGSGSCSDPSNVGTLGCEVVLEPEGLGTAEGFAAGVESDLDTLGGLAESAFAFLPGDGDALGVSVSECPLPEIVVSGFANASDVTELFCDLGGGPVRYALLLFGVIVSASIFIRGVGQV